MFGIGTIFKYGLMLRNRMTIPRTSPIAQQEKTLYHLLKKASQTEFGRYYGFDDILSQPSGKLIPAFQKAIPIFDYDQIFEQWWSKMLRGQSDVTWAGRINNFALSSGTSGSPSKYIPVSQDMIKAMRRTSMRMFGSSTEWNLSSNFYKGDFLFIGSCIEMTKHSENIWVGDVSGINTGKIPSWFEQFYRPGKRIASMRTWEERLPAIIEAAPSWNIKFIAGMPSWVQIILEKIIERYNLNTIHDLWKDLQIYVSGGVAFAPYRKRFEQLMGKEMIFLDTYYTSEGSLACQTRLDGTNMPMELILNNGIFFEFVPFNEANFSHSAQVKTNAPALTIAEVEENKEYAVLLSTCSGTWRYLLGDVIKFVDKSRSEIVITGRTKHFLSVCGEHLSVDNMNQAITHLEDQTNLSVPEFTVKAVKVEQHFEHHWYIACDQDLNETAIATLLDEKIASINDDYRTERRDNLLRFVRVHLLPVHKFYDWQAKQGKLGGQNKFPRVMTDVQFVDWLEFIKG